MKNEAIIDGEFVSEEISPATHEYLGLWKPPFEQCAKGVEHNFCKYFDTYNGLHKAWINGEFDKPIYRRT